MTTLAGEQVAGVTALTTLAVFEDIYQQFGPAGGTYNPAAAGERGFMKLAAAELDNGVNSVAHHLNTPYDIEVALGIIVPAGAPVPVTGNVLRMGSVGDSEADE